MVAPSSFKIPAAISGFRHPLSSPELTLGLHLDLDIMKTMGELAYMFGVCLLDVVVYVSVGCFR
jgi:hypothetical protein